MKTLRRKQKRRHVVFKVQPHEKLVVYDIYSRFAIELNVIEKSTGRMEVDFFVPGNLRIARGSLS